MTLIAKIEELRELEKKATPAPIGIARIAYDGNALLQLYADPSDSNFSATQADKELLRDLRNAAPALLAALNFRPGDADRLLDFMEYTGENCESPEEYAYLEMLKRLHGMAAKMEQEEKR